MQAYWKEMLTNFQALFSNSKASLGLFSLSNSNHNHTPHDMYMEKVALILFPFIPSWHYANCFWFLHSSPKILLKLSIKLGKKLLLITKEVIYIIRSDFTD